MRDTIKNVGILAAATVFALLACELIVRTLLPQNLSGTWRVESAPPGYQLNKSAGTARHQFGARVVHYRFAAPHLRNCPQRTHRGKRILVLGDSFTFGWLLDCKSTFVARLARRASERFGAGTFEFVNAAAGGWGTADQLAYTEDYASSIKPRAIVVFVNTDDIGRSIRRGIYRLSNGNQHQVARVTHATGGGRRSVLRMIKRASNAMPLYQVLLENSHLFQLARNSIVVSLTRTRSPDVSRNHGAAVIPHSKFKPQRSREAVSLAKALFLGLQSLSQRLGAKLIVFTTGWEAFRSDTSRRSDPTAAFMSIASAFFARHGIAYHDLSRSIRKTIGTSLSEYTIPGDGHPNERGARAISRAAWPELSQELAALIAPTNGAASAKADPASAKVGALP